MGPTPHEWSSYLPDGRPVRVRRLDDGWHVACEHRSETASELLPAMEAAVGLTDAELRLNGDSELALRRWVRQHSAQIEAERG